MRTLVVKSHILRGGLLALATCVGLTAAAAITDPHLVAHYTFDDPSNPLIATVGPNATVVDYSSAGVNEVAGLGSCACVTDPDVTAGLEAHSAALTIPRGQAVRIAHGVPTDACTPWCISMRVYILENTYGDPVPDPTPTPYSTLFSTYQNAENDAVICIKKWDVSTPDDYRVGGGANNADQTRWGYWPITKAAWHVITLSMGESKTCLYVDGALITTRVCSLADFQFGRLNLTGRPYLFLAGDNDGEDAPIHFDWVKVYDTDFPEELFPGASELTNDLVAYYTFDDASDPLAATLGSAATVVDYSNAGVNAVEGLGGCALVTETMDPSAKAGLAPGSGALMIPRGQSLRIAHGLSTAAPVPYCLSMRVYLPDHNGSPSSYNTLFATAQRAEEDSVLCIKRSAGGTYEIGGGNVTVTTTWGYYPITSDAWHVITLSVDEMRTTLFVDGVPLVSRRHFISEMRNARVHLRNRPYIFISGDNDGEDMPLYFDWIKIYNAPVPDSLITTTATWTGESGTDPANAANWKVFDLGGREVGGVPDLTTEIVLSGATDCNMPAVAGFACARLRLDGNVTLTADADWSGVDVAPWCGNGLLDLNGHRLDVVSLRKYGADGCTITNACEGAEQRGELHLTVPAGLTENNKAIRLDGNLKFVKDGEGTFVPSVGDITYSGGTDIIGGTFRCGVAPDSHVCGAWETTIAIASNSVFDVWGWGASAHLNHYAVRLDGGTLTCTKNDRVSWSDWTIGNLSLTQNSRLVFPNSDVTHDLHVIDNSVWDLGGCVLDVSFEGPDDDFYTSEKGTGRLTLRNGTIRTQGNGWFHDFGGIDGKEGGGLDLGSILRLRTGSEDGITDLSNLTVRATSDNVTSVGKARVWGTFAPVSNHWFQVELQDGATIDLSSRDAAWPITCTNVTGIVTVKFVDNANITLDLGERRFTSPTQVVAWGANDKPANVKWLHFRPVTSYKSAYSVSVRATGVYVQPSGIMMIFR